jgi:hypothetical protein
MYSHAEIVKQELSDAEKNCNVKVVILKKISC